MTWAGTHWQLVGVITAMLMASVIPLRNDPYYVGLGISTLMGVYLALCWNLAAGYGGLLSLGHPAFFGIGAYTTAFLYYRHDVNPWIGLVVGAGLAMFTSLAMAAGAFRFKVKGFYFALLTFAVALMFPALVRTSGSLGGSEGIFLPLHDDMTLLQMFDRRFFFWVFYGLVIAAILLTALLEQSSLGTQLRAVREDEDAAEALGVPAARMRTVVFAVSAAMTALAGGVFTFQTLLAHTETSFDFGRFLTVIVATILGGQGTLAGPVLGVLALTGVNEMVGKLPVTSQEAAALGRTIFGALLIVAGLLLSNGMVGLLKRAAHRFILTARPRKWSAKGVTATARGPELLDPAAATVALRPASRVATEPVALEVRNVTKRFGGLTAVADASFEVRAGQILALIGPNGAGKSTLLEICAGAQTQTSGEVLLKGCRVTGLPPYRLARLGLGRTFQNTRPFHDMSVIENVMVATTRSSRDPEEATVKALQCLGLVGLDLALGPTTKAAHLSTGQRKRLEIAKALGCDVDVLLLDEPFGGLDERSHGPLINLIGGLRNQGMAIVLVEHKLGVVTQLADEVLAMDRGRTIARGTPADVLSNKQVIEAYIGVQTGGE